MVRLFGKGPKSSKRPRYDDLYDNEKVPKDNNRNSYEKLVEKHLKRLAADEKTLEALGVDGDAENLDNDVEDLHSELVEMETRRRSRGGSRVRGSLVQARPHHKRGSAKNQRSDGPERDGHASDRKETGLSDTTQFRREEMGERRRLMYESLPPLVKPERDVSHNLPPLDEGHTETELHLPEI